MACTKIKYTEIGARIRLSKIAGYRRRYKDKHHRTERAYYYCEECNSYHLTSRRRWNGEYNKK